MPKSKSVKKANLVKRFGSVNPASTVLDVSYGYSSMQGRRDKMEDAHTAEFLDGGVLSGAAFFGVFDGHGGPGAARYCAQELGPALVTHVQELHNKTLSDTVDESEHNRIPARRFSDLFRDSGSQPDLVEAVQKAFKAVDAKMARSQSQYITEEDEFQDPGTTAVTLLVTKSHLLISNLGDSRALVRGPNGIVFNTKDHKPGDEKEKKRIEDAGGWVVSGRVCRILAVARALGDHTFKEDPDLLPEQQMLSPVPDVFIIPRSDDDEFVLMACDGVFEVMGNDEATKYVREKLGEGLSLSNACNSLVDACYQRGCKDNLTALLVCFPGAKRGVVPEPDSPTQGLHARKPSWVTRTFKQKRGSTSSISNDVSTNNSPPPKDTSPTQDVQPSQSESNDGGDVSSTTTPPSTNAYDEEWEEATARKREYFKTLERNFLQTMDPAETLDRTSASYRRRQRPRVSSMVMRLQATLQRRPPTIKEEDEVFKPDISISIDDVESVTTETEQEADKDVVYSADDVAEEAQRRPSMMSNLDIIELDQLNHLLMALEANDTDDIIVS
eukprot:m.272566 g.272566  ORF g.272566 m.272566 type:complete len:556 (+) comp16275_c1_seq11:197-1864(+)